MKSQRLTTIILIGMVLGIFTGYACHALWPDPKTATTVAGYISLMTDIFLRLIKMIIVSRCERMAIPLAAIHSMRHSPI